MPPSSSKLPQVFTRFDDLQSDETVAHLTAMAKRLGAWIQEQPEAGGDWVAAATILLAMGIKQSQKKLLAHAVSNLQSAVACHEAITRITFLFSWAWEHSELGSEGNFLN